MKFLKSILLVTACFGIALALCSCELMINKFKFETKDLNGDDDYSLAVFTDDDICVQDNACYCVAFGLIPSGSPSYPEEEYLHDADLIEANAKSPLSGVSLLQTTYGTQDTITFTVECSRTKGNVRIVLLDENLDIIHDFSITEKTSYTVNDAKGKKFEIRVAGESAEFSVTVSREFLDK
jgi:hypothetical protein